MTPITIRATRGKVSYDVRLRSKITVLQGDSAEGKTTFIKLSVDSIFTESYDVLTYSTGTGESLTDFINRVRVNTVVCLDEQEVQLFKDNRLLKQLCKKEAYFLFVYRKPLYGLRYDYRDVFVFRTTDMLTTLERAYPDYSELPKTGPYITEDQKSGNTYFSCWLPEVSSMRGKSNCLKYSNDEVLILDGAAIGCYIEALRANNVRLFMPPSFEYLVVKRWCKPDVMQLWSPKFPSWERFFSWLCEQSGRLPFKYSKKDVPVVVLKTPLIPWFSYNMCTYRGNGVYIDTVCEKRDSQDACRKLLEDIGVPGYFEDVYALLPDVLDPDTFEDTVWQCLLRLGVT